MRVLVACEFSGVVRDAFIERGHDAVSCDLLPSESPGPHIVGDVMEVLKRGWDLVIAHPPCRYLSNSGAKHLYAEMRKENGEAPDRWRRMIDAAVFFRGFLEAGLPRLAVENPIIHGHARKIIGASHSQIIQPWQFGHGESKATCLWLRGLPPLRPTKVVEGREGVVWRMAPHPDRAKNRSRTYWGVAEAMANQWGGSS